MTWMDRNKYAFYGGWFLISGILGMTLFNWTETTNLIILAVANVWVVAGLARNDVLKALEDERIRSEYARRG